MNTHQICSFRSGWLTRHMGKTRRVTREEDAVFFEKGYDARALHGDGPVRDAYQTMLADERAAQVEEVRHAA